jgi:4-diphosphocytidyl-2-C-methyl-D-erythritol kinase
LHVLALRDDGYHELRTVFQSLALHDTLTFTETTGGFALECSDPSVPADDSNLVWRAAQLLWRADGRRGDVRGVRVRLEKRIPAQAGLGGGSSDAAATLRALSRLWRLALPDGRLHAVARSLGADVAYFLSGGTALGVDRGDLLFQLADRPSQPVVIVRPPFGVSTRDAYAWWDAQRDQLKRPRIQGTDRHLPSSELGNDLEAPVAARHPEISRLTRRLRRLGARYAAMSGSGSAVFGLFEDAGAAAAAVTALTRPGWLVLGTKTVNGRDFNRLSMPK